jgi:hypothetical protein
MPLKFLAAITAMLLLVGLGGTARSLAGQSLGDVARQEEERRKSVKDPAKVITNKDLSSVPPGVASAPTVDSSTLADADAKRDATGESSKDAKTPAKDQKYWSRRLKDLQTGLDRDQSYSAALQSQINGLTTEFTARADPAQRAVIERNRQKALAELDRLKDAIVKDKKAIEDFNDEARRAGVPPGWLR